MAGKCHHPRGRGKILLRHMFLCRYVNPRVSLDGIDVFRVGHWGCFCRVQAHPLTSLLYNFVEIVHVTRRREDCLRRRPRIYLVSQPSRSIAMPLCCLHGSCRDNTPINVTEDYVSFCRKRRKRDRE